MRRLGLELLMLLVLLGVPHGLKMKTPTLQDYCNKSKESLPCQMQLCRSPNVEWGVSKPTFRLLNKLERMAVLDTHNTYRNELAYGRHAHSNFVPAAQNMQVISYDKEAEFLAICMLAAGRQQHRMLFGVSQNRSDAYGNNYFSYTNHLLDHHWRSRVLMESTTFWFLQGKYMNRKQMDVAIANYSHETIHQLGHIQGSEDCFTQLAWADTRYLGCAIAYNRSESADRSWQTMTVCVYYPPGNVEGGQMVKPGRAAAMCTKKNAIYKYLCGDIRKIRYDSFNSPLLDLYPPTYKAGSQVHLLDRITLSLILTLHFSAL